MNEYVQLYIEEAEEAMKKALLHVEIELGKIRAGRATPSILDGIKVDYYGVETPINQVANINSLDARTLIIQPWEKKMLGEIEKALLSANIGATPMNDGEVIRITMPQLTEERRKELVKRAKQIGEEGKIGIRNARHKAIDHIKSLLKEGLSEDEEKKAEQKIQELTKKYNDLVDKHIAKKEEEILHV